MSEEQTSYKVTDRRLFNPDGTPREVPESEKPEPKPEAPPLPTESASAADNTSPVPTAAAETSQAAGSTTAPGTTP